MNGRKVGSFGTAAAFSMNGPKPLSAGEGGFVLTNDHNVYVRTLLFGQYNKRCRKEIPTDHPLHRYAVTGMGLKLRIHPLAAALALDQLSRLDAYLFGRRRIADMMIGKLTGLPGLTVPQIPEKIQPAWYAMPLTYQFTDHPTGAPIEHVLAALHAEGASEIDRPGSIRPLNEHPLFTNPSALFPELPRWPRYRAGQFPQAVRLHRATLKVPVPHDDSALASEYTSAISKVLNHPDLHRRDANQ